MPSVTDNSEAPASVNAAVEALQKASRIPANQRAVKVSGVVDAICRYAFDEGLDADNLRAVVRIVSRKTELDQTSVTNLIKNLYPAQRVPADVVLSVVGALGQGKGKPSLGTQNNLVKWLIIVHGIIKDSRVLSRLYGVLFGMLDILAIRTSLCHLLSLTTRRTHVKPFRIQQLLELSRGLGNEPALQGLLRIYRDYYPDIILAGTASTRNSFPPRPDQEWQKRLLAIQDTSTALDEDAPEQLNGFRVLRKGAKRSKVSAIPEVHTFRANEMSVTLEEIDNAEDFVEKLERIEPPGQMISFLIDPLLQKYVELNPSDIVQKRIELWLSTYLEEEYTAASSGLATSEYFVELLDGLFKHTQYTKKLSSIVSAFLQAYLPIWDGVTGVDAILGLLSYIPFQPFEDVYANYLSPTEKALASHGAQAYDQLLQFYAVTFQHWTAWVSHYRPKSDSGTEYFNRKSFQDLVAHVSKISVSLLLSLPNEPNSSLVSSVLSFYELLSSSAEPGAVPIILPPPRLSYLLAQSASATALSRICGIYANYKTAFDKHPTPISTYYPPSTTIPFNSSLRDLYNLLWGSKALQIVDASTAFLCDPVLRETLNSYLTSVDHSYSIGPAFGFSHNALLASLSAAAWWSLEEDEIEKQGYDRDSINWHRGPVTQQTLEALGKDRGVSVELLEYKKHVLNWLEERGCGGIKELMYATHAKLKK